MAGADFMKCVLIFMLMMGTESFDILSKVDGSCGYDRKTWQCCVGWDGYDVCVDGKYVAKKQGIQFDFKVMNHKNTVLAQRILTLNKLCVSIPGTSIIELCVSFNEIQLLENEFSGCIGVYANILGKKGIIKTNLGCFNFSENKSGIETITYQFLGDSSITHPVSHFYDFWTRKCNGSIFGYNTTIPLNLSLFLGVAMLISMKICF